jgi:cation/acetate symporter
MTEGTTGWMTGWMTEWMADGMTSVLDDDLLRLSPAIGYTALVLVALSTVLIGIYGLRISRTTGDFYVASRTVRPWWNASAIGGEYLSAASFLGVAGLILISGVDALWFPIGYTAGYLMLLLFVAAPLRRSGAYTIPDFAQARLDSLLVRRVTSLCRSCTARP